MVAVSCWLWTMGVVWGQWIFFLPYSIYPTNTALYTYRYKPRSPVLQGALYRARAASIVQKQCPGTPAPPRFTHPVPQHPPRQFVAALPEPTRHVQGIDLAGMTVICHAVTLTPRCGVAGMPDAIYSHTSQPVRRAKTCIMRQHNPLGTKYPHGHQYHNPLARCHNRPTDP